MELAFLRNLQEKMCNCSRNSTIPVIYEAFSEWLRLHRREIAGKALPPINRVSRALGVARQTVRKVYLRLEVEHLIVRRQHERNWFVTPLKRSGPQNIALILPTMFSDYYTCRRRSTASAISGSIRASPIGRWSGAMP